MASVEGKVSLVGAGPGDPGLMTARALELIGEADVIFYDRLIPPNALAGPPRRGTGVRRQDARHSPQSAGRNQPEAG
ncbi:MAG TPA: SAM-dependent methyltransferase [Solirubrobacterales bacterium]|nr:SAM-dependent methyltransferase [Solirubrobacterales bacterium]